MRKTTAKRVMEQVGDERLENLLPQAARSVGLDSVTQTRWLLDLVNSRCAGDPQRLLLEACFFIGDIMRAKREKPEVLPPVVAEFEGPLGKLVGGTHFVLWTNAPVEHTIVLSTSGGAPLISHRSTSFADALKADAIKRIAENALKIHRCRRTRCGNFFIEDRRGQAFCSPKCAQMVRNERYLAKLAKGGNHE